MGRVKNSQMRTVRQGAQRKDEVVLQRSVREPETHVRRQIHPWMPVLDVTGAPVGHVSDPVQEDGYLLVEKGFFFTRLVYVPLAAVARVDAFGIHLHLRKEDLDAPVFAGPVAAPAVAG